MLLLCYAIHLPYYVNTCTLSGFSPPALPWQRQPDTESSYVQPLQCLYKLQWCKDTTVFLFSGGVFPVSFRINLAVSSGYFSFAAHRAFMQPRWRLRADFCLIDFSDFCCSTCVTLQFDLTKLVVLFRFIGLPSNFGIMTHLRDLTGAPCHVTHCKHGSETTTGLYLESLILICLFTINFDGN